MSTSYGFAFLAPCSPALAARVPEICMIPKGSTARRSIANSILPWWLSSRQRYRHTDGRDAEVVKQSTARKSLDLGLRNYSREDLEEARRAGQKLEINVLGLATIAADVTPELARATIASVVVLGALHASAEVKAALADRMR